MRSLMTVPRYLNLFDPAFTRAAETDEAEFVKALLRPRFARCQVQWAELVSAQTTRPLPLTC
jgi:hypothetical protein